MRTRRQLNVQQQNNLAENSIRSEAAYWRGHGVPEALRRVGEERGVRWDRSIVVELAIDFPGMPQLFGLLLTQDERFLYFEIDTDAARLVIETIHCWKDITSEQNLSLHNPGTGTGQGALAIKVLRELNA